VSSWPPQVLDVRAVDVGAMVRVQAEARARVTGVTQAAPFIRGRLEPLGDAPLEPGEVEEARRLMAELLGVMRVREEARHGQQGQQWVRPSGMCIGRHMHGQQGHRGKRPQGAAAGGGAVGRKGGSVGWCSRRGWWRSWGGGRGVCCMLL
jgi:hypothetical protein